MGKNKRKQVPTTTATTTQSKSTKGNVQSSNSAAKRAAVGASVARDQSRDRHVGTEHQLSSGRTRTCVFLIGVATAAAIAAIGFHYLNKGRISSQRPNFPADDLSATFGHSEIIVPSHQRASLLKPYTVDIQGLLRERERNMKKYDFNYSLTGVDRRSDLSLQEFHDVYDGKWPVLITDVVPRWNAFNWSRDFFFENYGQERVTMKAVDDVLDQVIPDVLPDVYPFAFSPDFEASYTKQNSLDQAVSLALPLELFYKNTHKAFPNRWTYVEDELFITTRPTLRKDIGQCDYLEEDFYQLFPAEVRPWNAMLLWGTKFSRSSLHIDPYNWTGTNAVIKGTKRWKLFPPGQDHLLSVMPGRKSGFPLNCYKYNSPVDAFDFDAEKYPHFQQAEVLEFEQRAGELLLIPPGWFHQAFNVEETIAISSQVMNRNNYRIILEEIIKVGNIKRSQLPPDINRKSPKEQIRITMSLLPQHILDRGREITADALYQIQHGHEDKRYQVPMDDN